MRAMSPMSPRPERNRARICSFLLGGRAGGAGWTAVGSVSGLSALMGSAPWWLLPRDAAIAVPTTGFTFRDATRAKRKPCCPSHSLGRERVFRRVALAGDLIDLRLALHGAGDGQLGRLVVVLVDFDVILGHPVDEHAADDDKLLRLA